MEGGLEGQVSDHYHRWLQLRECGREKWQNMGHRDAGEKVY